MADEVVMAFLKAADIRVVVEREEPVAELGVGDGAGRLGSSPGQAGRPWVNPR